MCAVLKRFKRPHGADGSHTEAAPRMQRPPRGTADPSAPRHGNSPSAPAPAPVPAAASKWAAAPPHSPPLSFGRHTVSQLPHALRAAVRRAAYPLLLHPQLSVRENATKALTAYVQRCGASEARRAMLVSLHRLADPHAPYDSTEADALASLQRLASRSSTAAPLPASALASTLGSSLCEVDPHAAEGLLALCGHLAKEVPTVWVLRVWQAAVGVPLGLLGHSASTVRQAASTVLLRLATHGPVRDDTGVWWHPLPLVLEECVAGWRAPDPTGAPAARPGAVPAADTPWPWREGRLLVYELVVSYLLAAHRSHLDPTGVLTSPPGGDAEEDGGGGGGAPSAAAEAAREAGMQAVSHTSSTGSAASASHGASAETHHTVDPEDGGSVHSAELSAASASLSGRVAEGGAPAPAARTPTHPPPRPRQSTASRTDPRTGRAPRHPVGVSAISPAAPAAATPQRNQPPSPGLPRAVAAPSRVPEGTTFHRRHSYPELPPAPAAGRAAEEAGSAAGSAEDEAECVAPEAAPAPAAVHASGPGAAAGLGADAGGRARPRRRASLLEVLARPPGPGRVPVGEATRAEQADGGAGDATAPGRAAALVRFTSASVAALVPGAHEHCALPHPSPLHQQLWWVLLHTRTALGDAQFELRRMAEQLTPALTELSCWLDVGLLSRLWRSMTAQFEIGDLVTCRMGAETLRSALLLARDVEHQLRVVPPPWPSRRARQAALTLVRAVKHQLPAAIDPLYRVTLARTGVSERTLMSALELLVMSHAFYGDPAFGPSLALTVTPASDETAAAATASDSAQPAPSALDTSMHVADVLELGVSAEDRFAHVGSLLRHLDRLTHDAYPEGAPGSWPLEPVVPLSCVGASGSGREDCEGEGDGDAASTAGAGASARAAASQQQRQQRQRRAQLALRLLGEKLTPFLADFVPRIAVRQGFALVPFLAVWLRELDDASPRLAIASAFARLVQRPLRTYARCRRLRASPLTATNLHRQNQLHAEAATALAHSTPHTSAARAWGDSDSDTNQDLTTPSSAGAGGSARDTAIRLAFGAGTGGQPTASAPVPEGEDDRVVAMSDVEVDVASSCQARTPTKTPPPGLAATVTPPRPLAADAGATSGHLPSPSPAKAAASPAARVQRMILAEHMPSPSPTRYRPGGGGMSGTGAPVADQQQQRVGSLPPRPPVPRRTSGQLPGALGADGASVAGTGAMETAGPPRISELDAGVADALARGWLASCARACVRACTLVVGQETVEAQVATRMLQAAVQWCHTGPDLRFADPLVRMVARRWADKCPHGRRASVEVRAATQQQQDAEAREMLRWRSNEVPNASPGQHRDTTLESDVESQASREESPQGDQGESGDERAAPVGEPVPRPRGATLPAVMDAPSVEVGGRGGVRSSSFDGDHAVPGHGAGGDARGAEAELGRGRHQPEPTAEGGAHRHGKGAGPGERAEFANEERGDGGEAEDEDEDDWDDWDEDEDEDEEQTLTEAGVALLALAAVATTCPAEFLERRGGEVPELRTLWAATGGAVEPIVPGSPRSALVLLDPVLRSLSAVERPVVAWCGCALCAAAAFRSLSYPHLRPHSTLQAPGSTLLLGRSGAAAEDAALLDRMKPPAPCVHRWPLSKAVRRPSSIALPCFMLPEGREWAP